MLGFFKKRKSGGTASVAKDRLRVIIEHEKDINDADIDQLQFEKDLLDVFRKHLGEDKVAGLDLKITDKEIDVSAELSGDDDKDDDK